jgi:xanthine dehydrogenase accessory factor
MNIYRALSETTKSKENIMITIITGSNIGEKLLLSDGEKVFISNEEVDWNRIIKKIPQDRKSRVITIEDKRIYIEFIHQSYQVVICGAGHISMTLIKMCRMLELPVTVIDDRLSFANNAKAAGADKVICEPFEEALDKIKGDKSTFFIIVTRGHRYDQNCLERIIKKDNAYIGMIGSRVRVSKVLNYLEKERNISRSELDRVYTPIGLKISAETPSEIAISIMAQVIEVKNKVLGSSTFSNEVLRGILDEGHGDMSKALITIVSRKGSAPREIGTKMIVLKDGTMIGTIGGGCVESDIRQMALSCMEQNQYKLEKVDMTGRDGEEDGMVCGGIIELFVEPVV